MSGLYQCDECGVSRSFSGTEPCFSHGTAPCDCGAAPVSWVPVPDVRTWFVPLHRSAADPLTNVVIFAGVVCLTWGDLWSAVGVQGAEKTTVSTQNKNGGLEGDVLVTRHLFPTGGNFNPVVEKGSQ